MLRTGECIKFKALVSDISDYEPGNNDHFIVDANVWLWMCYSKFSSLESTNKPKHYQLHKYPAFIEQAMKSSLKLYWTTYTLAEVFHVIEKFEFSLATQQNSSFNSVKSYRNSIAWRRDFLSEINSCFALIKSLGSELVVGDVNADLLLASIAKYGIDSYDYPIVKAALDSKGMKVLTDDGDFKGVEGLRLFTANNSVLKKAKEQDRLY